MPKEKPNPFVALRHAQNRSAPTEAEVAESEMVHESTRAQAHKRTSAQVRESASAREHESTSAQGLVRSSQEQQVVRKPSGQRIRADLLKAFKRLAVDDGVPQYKLMEDALEEYLARRQSDQSG